MRELLALVPRPTAVFAANDLMAMGALLASAKRVCECPRHGPRGFDDIPAARLVQPPLTTLDQHAPRHRTTRRRAAVIPSRWVVHRATRNETLGFALDLRAIRLTTGYHRKVTSCRIWTHSHMHI